MSVSSRRELLAVSAMRYKSASALERRSILDSFVSSTGYDRNYAISLLCHPPSVPSGKCAVRRRSKTYGRKTQMALESLWETAGCICGKRLVSLLPSLLEALERFGEIDLCPDVRLLLLAMSAATCDRLLARAREKHPHGLCTTKATPHLLLRSQVPVRTFSDWDEQRPGFMEIDLVAHCGDSARGTFLHSFDAVDVMTGWTICLPVPNKGQISVSKAIDELRKVLPFPLLGVDTDNGGEFINHNLVRYCAENAITMTRCRPYKKNDQCHIEQKNGNVVRTMIGYDRYEGPEAMLVLHKIYGLLADYQNFFQPSMKLISKSRDGARVTKCYDKAKTPYQQVLESPHIPSATKELLTARYLRINPAAVHRSIVRLQRQLRKLAVGYDPTAQGTDDLNEPGPEVAQLATSITQKAVE